MLDVGIWRQRFDTGFADARLLALDWQQLRPEGASIDVRVWLADRREDLAVAPAVGSVSLSWTRL